MSTSRLTSLSGIAFATLAVSTLLVTGCLNGVKKIEITTTNVKESTTEESSTSSESSSTTSFSSPAPKSSGPIDPIGDSELRGQARVANDRLSNPVRKAFIQKRPEELVASRLATDKPYFVIHKIVTTPRGTYGIRQDAGETKVLMPDGNPITTIDQEFFRKVEVNGYYKYTMCGQARILVRVDPKDIDFTRTDYPSSEEFIYK